MARKKPAALKIPQLDNSPDERTSGRILAAATRLFAAKGFDGTSTKEICDAAGVNIAAIHYHFDCKEELLRHITESFGGMRLQSIQRVLSEAENAEEFSLRLRMFLEEWIDVFIQQPEVWRIVQTEIELLRSCSEGIYRRTFMQVFETLVTYITNAKKKGIVGKCVDPRIAARFLFSQLAHQTRSDRVNEKYFGVSLRDAGYRKLWVQQTLQIFLGGVVGTGGQK